MSLPVCPPPTARGAPKSSPYHTGPPTGKTAPGNDNRSPLCLDGLSIFPGRNEPAEERAAPGEEPPAEDEDPPDDPPDDESPSDDPPPDDPPSESSCTWS